MRGTLTITLIERGQRSGTAGAECQDGDSHLERIQSVSQWLRDGLTRSETNLTEDSLASDQLGANANYKAQHC